MEQPRQSELVAPKLIVGFKGPREVGKTTVAAHVLCQLVPTGIPAEMYSMSEPLVELTIRSLEKICDLPFDENFDGNDASIKDTVLPTGKTFRQHLIEVSEGIKLAYGENYFVDAAKRALAPNGITLIHNVRFPAEAAMCDYIIDVRSEGVYNNDKHRSERLHATIAHDLVFQNDRGEKRPTIDDYVMLSERILEWYFRKKISETHPPMST